jgi:hypothetical protein
MVNPTFRPYSIAYTYFRSDDLSSLDRFNLARCARARMAEYCGDSVRFNGERQAFYSHVNRVDRVEFA